MENRFNRRDNSGAEKRARSRLLLATSLGTLLLGSGAFAPNAFAAEDDNDDIIVTARLREESITKAPVVVTALQGDKLTSQGISDLSRLGDLVPAVNIAPNFLVDTLYIRGIGQAPTNSGFEQQVGVFIDGAYYGGGHWINGSYVDLDRVEILKGPQGVYFGKNTIAGALNVTTKNPGDKFEGEVRTGYEFEARQRYVQAAVSVPITDTFAVRVVGRADKMDGWAKNVVTGDRVPANEDYFGRLTALWTPTDNFEANLKVSYDNFFNNGGYANMVVLGCQGGVAGGDTFFPAGISSCKKNFQSSSGVVSQETGQRFFTRLPEWATTLNMRWRGELGELASITSYNDYRIETLQSSTFTTEADGTSPFPSYNEHTGDSFSQEFRFQSDLKGPLNVLVGGFYQHTTFDTYGDFSLVPPQVQGCTVGQIFGLVPGPCAAGGPSTSVNDTNQSGDSTALFGEVQWQITPQWELDVGGRYAWEEKKWERNQLLTSILGQSFGFVPGGNTIAGKEKSNKFSPQATLSWRPTEDFMAFTSYKTGVLAGGFASTGPMPIGKTIDQFNFGPETTKGGEVGTKFWLLDRALQVNLAAYYYEYKDLQVNIFDPVLIATIVDNAGKAISKGVEADARWKLGSGFTLSGAVSYNDAYYKEYLGSCLASAPAGACVAGVQDFGGTHTDYAPKWSGRAQLDYNTKFGDKLYFFAGTGLSLSDDYLMSQIPVGDSFAKWDANATVEYGPMSLSLIGKNLTNEFVCAAAQPRPLAQVPSEYGCVIDRGREVRLEAAYRF